MVEFTLICAIPGDKDIFSVKINSNALVSELKDKIHAANPTFTSFGARALSLYKIDVEASNEQQAVKEIETIARKLRISDRLNSIVELNEVFPLGVSRGMVHILVKLPEGVSIDSRACGVVPMQQVWCRPLAAAPLTCPQLLPIFTLTL